MRKGEQTRQEIIRKAAPIFNQKGYDGAALSDLMRATGLEKGGIYRHFESKQELAGDAFDHAWKIAMETRFEGTDEIPNTVDRLKQIVRNFRDRRSGLVPGGCPLLNTAIDSDDGNPQLRAKARQALSSWLDRLQLIAEEGETPRRGRLGRRFPEIGYTDCQYARRQLHGDVVCSETKSRSISPAIILRSTSKPRYVRGNLKVELAIHECSRNSVESRF